MNAYELILSLPETWLHPQSHSHPSLKASLAQCNFLSAAADEDSPWIRRLGTQRSESVE